MSSSNNNMKQIKEKPSFWKKLGLGKVSHKKSEDNISVQNRNLSHAPSLQHISATPAPTPISTYSTALNLRQEQQVPPLPVVPRNSSLKHAATIHTTANTVNGANKAQSVTATATTTTTTTIPQQEVEGKRYYSNAENKDILNAPIFSSEQPNATPLNMKHTAPKLVARTRSTISATTSTSTSSAAAPPSTTTSTVTPSSTTSSTSHDPTKKKNNKTKKQKQVQQQQQQQQQQQEEEKEAEGLYGRQAGVNEEGLVAAASNEEENSKDEKKMMSSFVMVERNNGNSSPKDKDERVKDNEGLWQIISALRKDLENEKATVLALQKQKEAVAKDLDYFEMTVDELYAEKKQLTQQLEVEKTKSQGHLEELNILLEKMKSNADNARDKSFALDQVNNDLKKAQDENKDLLKQIKKKEKAINDLKKQLKKSQEQTDSLKETNDTLNQEILDLKDQNYILQQEHGLLKSKMQQWQTASSDGDREPIAATTPEVQSLGIETEQGTIHDDDYITAADAPIRIPKKTKLSQKGKKVPLSKNDDALDTELDKLLKEKEKLQSSYSKIPLTGGGPQSRRRREELEEMLDQVDSQLSRVKQKIKRS